MPAKKLPKGFGYVLTWLREKEGLSQSQFARKMKEPTESLSAVLASIKSIEANRKCVTIAFLERAGRRFEGLKANWWQFIPPPSESPLQIQETRAAFPRSRPIALPSLWLPMAPDERLPNLRSLFVIDKSQWTKSEEFPPYFTFPGVKHPGTKELDGYPIIFADAVLEGDMDVDDDKVRVGDRFAVRTDLIPSPGDLVLATGKKGERIRRLFVQSEDRLVLRHFTLKKPDIAAGDVNMIEGVLCGRLRRFKDVSGVNAVFIADGRMTVSHL